MRTQNIIQNLRKVLHDSIDSTPEKASRFFKMGPGDYAEHDRFMGITVPRLRKIAKGYQDLTLDGLSHLLQSAFNEERLLALIILTEKYKTSPELQKNEIFQFYCSHFHAVNNWNLVDSSAHLIIGAHLFKKECSLLEKMACSDVMWERRIAIVATWYFIRQSELDWTFRIATLLKNDPHDLIHKAVGWMLRETGKKNEQRLLSFLALYAHQMPKTMLNYALERLTQEQKIAIKTHP